MKIVLVFTPLYLESMYNLPPLGLINLPPVLEGSGHEIEILDFVLAIKQQTPKMGKNLYDECADRVMGENPDLVGSSVQCTTYPAALNITKKIRERKNDVKIVFTGHTTSFVDITALHGFRQMGCINISSGIRMKGVR